MSDTELLDWLDSQENLTLTQDDDAYWYIRHQGEIVATGFPFIREAIIKAKRQYETHSTL